MRAPLLAPLLTLGAALAGCVSPPSTAEVLATGFRTPTQTFKTFQIAVRAEEPSLEYRCFSSSFLSRNRLSAFNYREYRDELARSQPFLRKGIADAEVVELAPLGGASGAMRLLVKSHGRWIQIDLVQDEFRELWAGDQPVVDELASFRAATGVQEDREGVRYFYAQVPLPAGQEVRALSEVRVGREWKIDGLSMVDPPAARAGPGVRADNRLE